MSTYEHAFITKRYKILSKQYVRIINTIAIFIGLCMIGTIYGKKVDALENNHEVADKDIIGIIICSLFIMGLFGVCIYYILVHKYYLDFKDKQKTIEPLAVKYKQHLMVKGSFRYYVGLIHAKHKLVEVSEADYAKISIGDEINIEYASHTNEFFSYF